MKVKTSELAGRKLDWAVAKAEGGTDFYFDGIIWSFILKGKIKVLTKGWVQRMNYTPSTDWAIAGPIIEREELSLEPLYSSEGFICWQAYKHAIEYSERGNGLQRGETPLIAGLRAYVTLKLGDEVELPEELV